MGTLINIICALSGAIVGSWFGHQYTIRLSKEKSQKQKKALVSEVNIINQDFTDWLVTLMEEYKKPLRESYSGPPRIYTQLIDNLIIELSGTDEILSVDQRNLLVGLQSKKELIAQKDRARDKYVNRFITASDGELTDVDETDITKGIQFWTALLLQEAVDIVFHTSKFEVERDSFTLNHYNDEERVKVICARNNFPYEEKFWMAVLAY
ncbi:TPA: hypothetical protein ACPJ10_001640 [Vibrio diabolicus]